MPLHPRRTVLSGVAALAVLLAAAPSPRSALALLADPARATDPTAPLVAAVALAAWALALWLVVTVAVVLASRTPGLLGRAAAAIGRRVAPLAVRRALEVALGVTVTVAASAAPAAASAAPATGASAQVRATSAALPSLDWPGLTQPPATQPPATQPSAAPSPAASSPAPVRDGAPPPQDAPPVEAAPVEAPPPAGRAAPPAGVVVAAGDSLWALAEAHLERTGTASPTDRQVAAAWPQWWSANRDVVGDDPDLIHPGTVLQPPGP